MDIINMFKTFDGEIFDTQKKAYDHLDAIYGSILVSITYRICELDGKYASTLSYIDNNVEEFRKLLQIKDDMILSNTTEDE